jgi:hypothetical protein
MSFCAVASYQLITVREWLTSRNGDGDVAFLT